MNDVWYVSGVFHTQGSSYKCEETETLDLSDGLEMDVSYLQYRAFGTTVNDTFSNAGNDYTVKPVLSGHLKNTSRS